MEYKNFCFEDVSFLYVYFVHKISYVYLCIVNKILSLLKIVEKVWSNFSGARIIVVCKHLIKVLVKKLLPIWKREGFF